MPCSKCKDNNSLIKNLKKSIQDLQEQTKELQSKVNSLTKESISDSKAKLEFLD